MNMDMSQQTVQTKYHHQAYQQDIEITILTQDDVIDPHLTITTAIGTIAMIIVTVTVTHAEVAPDNITNSHATAHHATETQVHIATDETPHTEGPHHTEVSPGIAVGPDPVHHTNTKHQNHLTASNEWPGNTKTRNINR